MQPCPLCLLDSNVLATDPHQPKLGINEPHAKARLRDPRSVKDRGPLAVKS